MRLAVTDTGPGIPNHLLMTIFEPFTKEDDSYATRHAGAGVGLAVAKRLVESIGGTIGVESEPGMGAKLWIAVPAVTASSTQESIDEEHVTPPSGLSLLAYLPDETMRSTVERLLAPFGNSVSSANTLAQAVTMSARGGYALIVAAAANVDAFAAAPGQRTPILALATAEERHPDGADAVLRWPAGPNALFSAIISVTGEGPKHADGAKDEQFNAAIDAKAISDLEKSLGFKTLIDILQSYMHTADELAASLSATSDKEDWSQAGRLAQDFAGAAGGLGLSALTTAARLLAQGARDGAGDRALSRPRTACSRSTPACVRRCAASIPTFRRRAANTFGVLPINGRSAKVRSLRLPHLDLPALALTGGGAVLARASGETRELSTAEARNLVASGDLLICHAMFAGQRLNARLLKPLFDLLELFAFVRPGEPCLPSPLGLARALRFAEPHTPEESARTLHRAASALFDVLLGLPPPEKARARKTAAFMAKAGWRWGPSILAILGEPERMAAPLAGIDAWRGLPEWEDEPPPARPGSQPVETEEAQAAARRTDRARRRDAVRSSRISPPPRPPLSHRACAPAPPRIALVEAGTGTGKTLGYLAPASLWAEKNGPGLWISTYTRNLQRQILQEAEKLERGTRARPLKVVLRKGRENYLCLLNFEDAAKRNAHAPGQRAVALGLIARWLAGSPDGDLSGAGFPAFLASAVPLRELTDRRGECIYAACPHYRVCFIERGLRRAHAADIVIANHALVMAQATHEGLRAEEADDVAPERRVRYVFDEGHHLFDAADSAFAAELSGAEMAELRRWIRGPEGRQSRARGLNERVRDLVADEDGASALEEALAAAGALAGEGWQLRMRGGGPRGPGEIFLAHVYTHVRARSADGFSEYGLEADVRPLAPELLDAARKLDHWLTRLGAPLNRLAAHLRARLDKEAAELESALARADRGRGARARTARASSHSRLARHAGSARGRAEAKHPNSPTGSRSRATTAATPMSG